MFSQLTNFAHKRNKKQALGFYLSYLVTTILLGGLFGILAVVLGIENVEDVALKIGMIVSLVCVTFLWMIILSKKKLSKGLGFIMIGIVASIFALLGGAFLGLIYPAYLTTRESKAHHHSHKE